MLPQIQDGQLSQELFASAESWNRTFTQASELYQDSMIYRSLSPFVDFVRGLRHNRLPWRDRLYVLFTGRLPLRAGFTIDD